MADAFLFGLVQGIIEKLGSEALQEISLFWGAKHELKKLENSVSTIKNVRLDAEDQSVWLGKLKEVVYDADDLLDDFSTEALRRRVMSSGRITKEVRLFFSRSNQFVYALKMGREVRAIIERLDAISADSHFEVRPNSSDGTRNTFMGESFVDEEAVIGRDEDKDEKSVVDEEAVIGRDEDKDEKSVLDEEAIIGRDEDKDAILKRLMDDSDENVCVIPIVGIGGIGKTTLARLVYNDSHVQDQFAVKMWVCVSVPFEVDAILHQAIQSATGKKSEGSELRQTFQEMIQGKKYLLILDDVWNEDALKWEELEGSLHCGGKGGSRVIVTTRSLKVAVICSRLKPHMLERLSSDEAWGLFVNIVSRRHELETLEAIEIGKQILAKCEGLPLAIKTIARLLSQTDPKTEWRPFMENEFLKVDHEEYIWRTLKFSYDHLPSHLKQCFAYCGLFPKGYEIEVRKLIHQWIAHGFVSSNNPSQSLEEVGMKYFKELVARSFFQEVRDVEADFSSRKVCKMQSLEEVGKECFEELSQRSFFQEVRDVEADFFRRKVCKMHDLIQELAVSVAGSEITTIDVKDHNSINSNIDAESEITIIDVKDHNGSNSNIDEKIRHLSFKINYRPIPQYAFLPFPDSLNDSKRVRTILGLTTWYYGSATLGNTKAILSKYRRLRVLGLSNCNWDIKEETLNSNIIGKLKHLRYLDLSYHPNIEVLPKLITRLVNLQVLNLTGCHQLRQLPIDIKKLINLRHLYNRGCEKLRHMPSGIGELTSLETLSMFVLSKGEGDEIGGLDELKGLNNLRGTLEIGNLEYGVRKKAKVANLKAKQYLQDLCLKWCGPRVGDEMCLEMLQPHHNLKALMIKGYPGAIFPSWISSLTNLVALTLIGCKRIRHPPTARQLPALEELTIDVAPDLEYIEEEESIGERGHISSLKKISIFRCPKLEGWWKKKSDEDEQQQQIPQFLCLSHLEIVNCEKLTSMPLFPTLEKELSLEETSIEPLKETMKMMTDRNLPSSSSSLPALHSSPLSKLKKLSLRYINDLHEFPEEWLQKLTSLQTLVIEGCRNLKSLPQGICDHTSWQRLSITGCLQLRDARGKTIYIHFPINQPSNHKQMPEINAFALSLRLKSIAAAARQEVRHSSTVMDRNQPLVAAMLTALLEHDARNSPSSSTATAAD